MIIRGKVWKFGDDINTDLIIAGKYKLSITDMDELSKHAMEALIPGFAEKVNKGDIIVAGKNFGCGSSREQAPLVLKHIGIGAVVAKSFARIFYRNAINIGLPVLEAPGIFNEVDEGDALKIILEEGKIIDETKNKVILANKLPDFILEILKDGGLIEHLIKVLGSGEG